MEKLSHRQYLVMKAWLRERWNKPTRTDHYLMRIAQRCQQIMKEEPDKITLEHQRVEFETQVVEKSAKLTEEEQKQQLEEQQKQRVEASKSRWKGLLGIGRKNAKRR